MIRSFAAIESIGTAERLWWGAAVLFLLAFICMGVAHRFDPRVIGSENVWVKPLKFAISTAVHFATIALAVHYLRPAWGANAWMSGLAIVSITAAFLEVGYIAVQGARGLPSHFNVSTPTYAILWSLMAAGAVLVLAPMAVVGVLALADDQARWPLAIRVGVAAGMIGGAVLTLVTAFRLGANMSHFVGPVPLDDTRMALTGWSLRGADLRPAHFLATHMAQAVPIASLLASSLLAQRAAAISALLFAFAWTALTLIVFANALAGRAMIALVRP
jgi:hypothetical protein